ncbi:LysE family translocator [Phytohalomonas tamaricis]|uniref:LysE family translocator n=1 Tax=Phytohalomonas tamaricis TaxID=2081032 RepID=UPI000D0ABEF5|nr:LysE family translocator [Phytohalomonas tamaricis]
MTETLAWLVSLALFAVPMTGTPGPNNVMLTASGALYGYRRTLPHIFGILCGGIVLFTALALGLGLVFQRFPMLQLGLKLVGSLYLLYLAWKIARAAPPDFAARNDSKPLTFGQAALFQFINPKVWVMGMALVAGFMPSDGNIVINAFLLALLVEVIAFPCISVWAGFGMAIGRTLRTPRAWRIFNITMGVMTAGCVVFILR